MQPRPTVLLPHEPRPTPIHSPCQLPRKRKSRISTTGAYETNAPMKSKVKTHQNPFTQPPSIFTSDKNPYLEFADCARGRTVTATWLCRAQRLAMNSCMLAHATRAEEDAAREEWFQGREERRMKRELEAQEVERRRREVLELTKREEEKDKEKERGKRGWWG